MRVNNLSPIENQRQNENERQIEGWDGKSETPVGKMVIICCDAERRLQKGKKRKKKRENIQMGMCAKTEVDQEVEEKEKKEYIHSYTSTRTWCRGVHTEMRNKWHDEENLSEQVMEGMGGSQAAS